MTPPYEEKTVKCPMCGQSQIVQFPKPTQNSDSSDLDAHPSPQEPAIDSEETPADEEDGFIESLDDIIEHSEPLEPPPPCDCGFPAAYTHRTLNIKPQERKTPYAYPCVRLRGLETAVFSVMGAGLYFRKDVAKKFFSEKFNTEKLSARFDKGNEHDANSIAIDFDGELLCYVPRDVAALIARLPQDLQERLYLQPLRKTAPDSSGYLFEFNVVELGEGLTLDAVASAVLVKINATPAADQNMCGDDSV